MDITVSPSTEKQVHELAAKQGVDPEHIVSEAVSGLHRIWFGSTEGPKLGTPFKKMFSDRDAEVVLRQVVGNRVIGGTLPSRAAAGYR